MAPSRSRPEDRRHKYDLDLSEDDIENLLLEIAYFGTAALEESTIKHVFDLRCDDRIPLSRQGTLLGATQYT